MAEAVVQIEVEPEVAWWRPLVHGLVARPHLVGLAVVLDVCYPPPW